jgi:hypothetical protein
MFKIVRCTHCNRVLKGKMRWLEMDQRDWTYHDRGGVPEDKSQGWFPFGPDCAATILERERSPHSAIGSPHSNRRR